MAAEWVQFITGNESDLTDHFDIEVSEGSAYTHSASGAQVSDPAGGSEPFLSLDLYGKDGSPYAEQDILGAKYTVEIYWPEDTGVRRISGPHNGYDSSPGVTQGGTGTYQFGPDVDEGAIRPFKDMSIQAFVSYWSGAPGAGAFLRITSLEILLTPAHSAFWTNRVHTREICT